MIAVASGVRTKPVPIDKGAAAMAFAERVGTFRGGASVLYAGADQTDEDALASGD